MIQHFSKQPPTIVGSSDGSFENPYYWSEIAEDTTVIDLDKINCANAFKYVKVNLTVGTEYSISCSADDFDTYLEIQDLSGNILDYNDDNGSTHESLIIYTPDESGDFIVCYKNYGGEGSGGWFSSAVISPAPNAAEAPIVSLEYTTSSGFNAFGRPLKYRSASEAGVAFSAIPTEGLLLYLPFSSDSDTAETGQSLVKSGTQSYTTLDGVPCVNIESGYIRTAENSGITGTQSRTFSFWANPTNWQSYCNAVGCGASKSTGKMFNCGVMCSEDENLDPAMNIQFTTWGNDINRFAVVDDGKLHHFAYVYSSETPNKLTIYIDGVASNYNVSSINTENSPFWIGRSGGGQWNYTGYLAAVRCYERALSADEVQQLAKEFDVV